jgi:hypothetical protein
MLTYGAFRFLFATGYATDLMKKDTHRKRLETAREYRFVLVGSLVVLLITSIPYAAGALEATQTRVFGGFVYAVEDGYSYLAKMRQGAEGKWLFHIAYTPESHRGTLFFPFHLLLGRVAALLPGPDLTTKLVWVYHGARWFFGLGLLLMVYCFLATLTDRVRVRRLAWLMIALGGGLGWLLIALGQPGWLGSMPLDLILPEGFTFLVLYAFPHIALGRTLLLGGLLFLLRAWGVRGLAGGSPPLWAALAGVLWLLMGLIVPFYVGVAWAVTGAAWVVWAVRRGRIPWRAAFLAGGAALLSAPVVAYSAWVFTQDPIYGTWAAQNLILSPHPFHYLAAYGVPLLLAAFAARRAWRAAKPAWVALAWVGVVPLLIYLPFNLQRRLVEGVQIPLSLLAAWGLVRVVERRRLRRPLIALTLGMMTLTNAFLIAGNTLTLRGRPAPIYRDAGEVAALDWLAERADPGDVVLAAYETGNYLPARVHVRVFVGHGPESVRAAEKRALVAHFFDAGTADAWRQDLLAEYGVDYVFWGPAERRLGAFDPLGADFLRPVYQGPAHTILEVES